MYSDKAVLKQIPKVDDLLRHPAVGRAGASPLRITEAVRQVLDRLRGDLRSGVASAVPPIDALADDVLLQLRLNLRPNLRRVINGTGVVLHTNLGRAPLSQHALEAVAEAAAGYSTLEYNVTDGTRGSRHSHVEAILTRLTGAEAAMVVNNNAAAVMLILSATAAGQEVIVSRGELVEIGGSFRVPDVMAQSGCRLREVGTTNKTHASDYIGAISPETTGALMKIHTSNFKVVGFTQSISPAELVAIGRQHGLPVIEDLGSGCMLPLGPYGIADEPVVSDSVAAGVDIVSFSGDKLLGGPQAGIIVGKKTLIDRMKRHPLARALRIDKLTLSALEATLRLYLDPAEAIAQIPVLRMLTATPDQLRQKADTLAGLLGGCAEVIPEHSQVGGGSVPTQMLPTWAVALCANGLSANALEEKLRLSEPSIIGRIAQNRLLLDVRTLDEADFTYIAARVVAAASGGEGH